MEATRLPRALTAAFIDNALKASKGIAGLSAAMRGLIARTAVMTAVAAIDADMRRMTRASAACRRLMTIPGVGQLTALAFVAAIDDPSRIRRSRDIGAYFGLVPRRYQSGKVDYTGGISKCGDRWVRTLLYEAANVMLTRYKGQLKLKDWVTPVCRWLIEPCPLPPISLVRLLAAPDTPACPREARHYSTACKAERLTTRSMTRT